jgi:predicted RND superfamily exporter protein
MGNLTARTPEGFLAMGLITPKVDVNATTRFVATAARQLKEAGVFVSGWSLLGNDMFERVRARFPLLVIPMLILVLLSLWFAFRAGTEIFLSIAVLLLSASALLAFMSLAGWQWNLMNLMAVPLILGAGVDYSIFMQLALRRHHGNLKESYHAVGRALLLCGGTAVAGFASLGLSSNAGMSSLGLVCAVGIGLNMVISVYLLPVWWRLCRTGAGDVVKNRASSGH